ncbi:MAG: hypothetical protein PUK76_02850 [Treponema sp.]|nr:hypothetical protein [Treponema sp.]
MKKVIGVAVAASLVAGMAFAEVSVSLNSRLRSNMYHFIKNENGNKETYTFDLNNAKSHGGSGAMSDALGFKAKTDYAGVSLELTEGSIKYKNEENKDKTASFMKNDAKWNGWLRFGGLTLSFGQFDSRFIGRYNTTMGESGLLDSDYAKYGLTSLADGDAKFLKDANNFSAVKGSRKNALVADYTFADVAGGKLLVKAALLENNYKTDEDDVSDKKYTKAGFGFEADYQSDSVAVQALFKKLNEDQMILGAYVEPKGLPFNTVLGFTYASQKDGKFSTKYTNAAGKDVYGENPQLSDISAYAVDLRFKYKVTDAATIAALAKYESVKVKEADETDTALALGAEVSYVVSDKIGAFFDIMYINADLDDEDNAFFKGAASKVQVRPGVKLTAGKNAAITAAFQYDNYIDSDDRATKTEYSIPVIFRVKL